MSESSYILFKHERQMLEWETGKLEPGGMVLLHPALKVLVLAAALWLWRHTGQPALVTHLLRTPDEQRSFYPDKPDFRSPHEFGRAADLRTSGLTDQQADDWTDWINASFEYRGRPGIVTALVHEVGGHGRHLHLQVGPEERRPQPRETLIA